MIVAVVQIKLVRSLTFVDMAFEPHGFLLSWSISLFDPCVVLTTQ
jgi:hypothetical protein